MSKVGSLFYLHTQIYHLLGCLRVGSDQIFVIFFFLSHCKGLNGIFQTLECTHQQWVHLYSSFAFSYWSFSSVWEYLRFSFSCWSFSAVYRKVSLDRSLTCVCLLFDWGVTVILLVCFSSSSPHISLKLLQQKRSKKTLPFILVFKKPGETVGILCASPCFASVLKGASWPSDCKV